MKERGFTLIEMAVVLAIIAVLAAILTPVVTGYLDQARISRATGDVRTIADAIRLYNKDTDKWPIYSSYANALNNTTPYDLLFGPGNAAVFGTTAFASYTLTNGQASVISQLNNGAAGMNTGFSSGSQVSNPGKVAFRGPYIGALDTDPWGNAYYVTSKNLNPNSTNWAFVISAGPNGTWETVATQPNTATIAVTGDDIVAVIK